MSGNTIIIGAGVIGAATALALQKDGHAVTLVDRSGPCAGASFGNAGAIVNGSCAPTAMPGILFDAVRMLTRPNSPISIRAAYLGKIAPWLFRFILQSRRSRVDRNAADLYALTEHAVASWRRLSEGTELSALFRAGGWLKVYEHEKTFAAAAYARALLDKHGSRYELLGAADIRDLEPNLAPIYQRGIFQQDSLGITNPERLVMGMVDLYTSRGGVYKQFAVDRVVLADDSIRLEGQGERLRADKVVVAAGAWSRTLARQLGDDIPLETERGYHLMLPESSGALLSRAVVNEESSFVLTPMESGLRMVAQIEFGGLDIAPNYSRIRALLPHAKRMLPKLEIEEKSVWMGFRPSLPDSLPVLGFASKSQNVFYAFGHQHLGMTLGAVTGEIVADLFANREPPMDLSPYRPDRFNSL